MTNSKFNYITKKITSKPTNYDFFSLPIFCFITLLLTTHLNFQIPVTYKTKQQQKKTKQPQYIRT